MNLETYLEQHKKLKTELSTLEALARKGNVVDNATEIAACINSLSGVLSIHLVVEDKYLYPELRKQNNPTLTKIVEDAVKEIGGLGEEFTKYKNAYNSKSKVIENANEFASYTRKIVAAITKRMEKEEQGIYKYLG